MTTSCRYGNSGRGASRGPGTCVQSTTASPGGVRDHSGQNGINPQGSYGNAAAAVMGAPDLRPGPDHDAPRDHLGDVGHRGNAEPISAELPLRDRRAHLAR